MAGALTAAIASIFSGSAVTADPYFEYTTLLLPGSGTNGAQNNTFLDGSTNNFTITRNGNTTQGTFSPFSQTGWGNYFDGTGDYLTVPDNAALELGTANFTIELWVYPTSFTATTNNFLIGKMTNSSTASGFLIRLADTTGTALFYASSNGSTWDIASGIGTVAPTLNTWNHIAVSRSGSNFRIWVNGVSGGTTTSSGSIQNNTSVVGIGAVAGGGGTTFGYISNARIVNGTAVYDPTQTTLTVPTTPLTAITNTALLTCQSNRFIDNSTNNFTITRNGDTSVVAFSPFNPTASWSAATYGGSGYFDGSGDYLSIADNDAFALGSNDWTIECWVYVSSLSSQGFVAQVASNGADASIGFVLGINASGYPYVASYINGAYTAATASTAIVVNQWNHIAGSRASGTMGVFLNGSRLASTAVSGSSVNSTATVTVGASNSGASALTTGYIANARIVNGTAVYSGTTYTVPTAPLTAITNTSLLLNFTNAGIYDATSKNDLETVADAQISNTTAKWGSTSIKFDGTGDSLLSPSSNLFTLGDSGANFTIDFWIYVDGTQTSSTVAVAGTWVNNSSAYANRWLIGLYSSGSSIVWHNSSAGASAISSSITSSAWNYVAIVRSGSTITMYINGSSVGTQTTNQAYTTDSPLRLGGGITGVGDFKGYIQDFRITKGYARTITTPTAAFPTL